MADGRHFEKRKMSITQPLFEISSPNLVRWWPCTSRSVPVCHFWAITKFKMAADRHFGKRKIAITRPPFELLLPFFTMIDMDSAQRAVTYFWPVTKSKMANGRHFEKKENVHNSAAFWDIFTKFVTLVAMDSPQCPRMSFLGYNEIQDEKRKIAITRPPFEMLLQNLAWW